MRMNKILITAATLIYLALPVSGQIAAGQPIRTLSGSSN